jgi:twitching motility protein PilT
MEPYDDELQRIVAELNRAVPHAVPSAASNPGPHLAEVHRPAARAVAGPVSASGANLEQLLSFAAQRNASDVLLIAGAPIALRLQGAISTTGQAQLTSAEIQDLLFPLITHEQQRELQQKRSLDFGFVRPNGVRCRANMHFQRGAMAASIRLLPARIPTLESLHLPGVLAKLTERRQGLVLVTGPTGCGKTSTLAALIDLINNRNRFHIVAIEDPIEYHHPNLQSIVEQIEVGRDTPDFVNSLRGILRQNPDIILVGEMRDPETIATVLTAAETGHMVFSTLHTNDAVQAVSRILDSFPAANQPQIRQQLSLSLNAVIAQQLVPGLDGTSRFPAVEILVATDAVRHMIRKGEDHQLRLQLSTGRADGMRTMEQSLVELVRSNRITRDTAFAHCFRSDDLKRHLE